MHGEINSRVTYPRYHLGVDVCFTYEWFFVHITSFVRLNLKNKLNIKTKSGLQNSILGYKIFYLI